MKTFLLVAALVCCALADVCAQDAKFAADNLKYSRDFYSKVHFVAIAKLPQSFKYDRYPSGGPERIQCDAGTYLREHGKPWMHLNDTGRTGLPIDYAERSRYVMTFASREDWGRSGDPVDNDTARKVDGWIKLVDAALNAAPASVKLVDKSEVEGRGQWIFEATSENPNGAPTRFTFRKPINDKTQNVLLHEFSGSIRLEGDKVVPAGAADLMRLGFGYMMNSEGGYEVSEFVWEEMQQAREKKGPEKESPSPGSKGAPESSYQGGTAEPKSQDATYFNRAKAKAGQGDLDGAIADYNLFIQLEPKEAAAYNNRGLAKQAKGDLEGAIADYTHALELNPKDASAYNNRGGARDAKGDSTGAIADDSRAIELDPKDPNAYYSRGLAKKHKSDYDGAIADYNHVLKLDPKFARAYCDRGVAKRKKGDLDGAIDDYNRTIELDSKYAIAYANRGNAKDEKGHLDEAIADYTRAIQLNPKFAGAYNNRAETNAKKKQYDAAIKDTEKAIELDPKNGGYYLSLAWYQLFNRKPREAITTSLNALKLSPGDAAVIKTNLAHGYLFDNQFDKAKAIYLENKDAKVGDDKRTFSQAVLDDFKEFQEAGITHPDMEKIKALFAGKDEQ